MKIFGLQKMTLLDYPGRVACTVFLGGCDFRCPFCHNFELVDGTARPVMEENELLSFLKKRSGILDGVAITGGEPCLHHDLPDLIRHIRELGFPVKLDTNGFLPEMLEKLLKESLVDYVAMDIKNRKEKYAMTCGLETMDLSKIDQSMQLLKSGNIDYEFRTTVARELITYEDFLCIARWINGAKAYFLQPYRESKQVLQKGFNTYFNL